MPIADEDAPRAPQAHAIGADLSTLSLDELTARIAMLRDEIARVEAAIAAKRESAAAADKFFRR
ncbi:MAG: DUF1192 domain-containing protein [Bauldia sp.]|nr:DUF1192 domain-containing protein [Bauldia sp.]